MLSAGDGDGGAAVFSVPVIPVSWAYRCSLYAMKRAVSSSKRILFSLNSAGFLVRWMLVARVMRCLRRRLGAYSPLLLLISLDSGVESSSLLGAAANSGVSANASSMDSLLGKSGEMSDGRALL